MHPDFFGNPVELETVGHAPPGIRCGSHSTHDHTMLPLVPNDYAFLVSLHEHTSSATTPTLPQPLTERSLTWPTYMLKKGTI